MRFITYKALSAVNALADQYSPAVDVSSAFTIGLHAHVLSGDAKGKCYVQVSLDGLDETPTDWNTLPNQVDLTGATTTGFVQNDLCANWARVWWDHQGGTAGTMRAHIKTNGY